MILQCRLWMIAGEYDLKKANVRREVQRSNNQKSVGTKAYKRIKGGRRASSHWVSVTNPQNRVRSVSVNISNRVKLMFVVVQGFSKSHPCLSICLIYVSEVRDLVSLRPLILCFFRTSATRIGASTSGAEEDESTTEIKGLL